MAGAYVQQVAPLSTTIIALPPPNQSGGVKYGNVFVSLATDFGPAAVRLAIGRPGGFRVEEVQVPTGRDVVRRVDPNVGAGQVVSVVHRSGPPVSVLVEFETRPDF